MEGYFLPPISFSVGEAVSLLLGMTLLRSLRVRPLAAALETGERKLVAAIPEHLRATLADARKVIGFEGAANDVFHLEWSQQPADPPTEPAVPPAREDAVVDTFLQAVLDRRTLVMHYRSPYRDGLACHTLIPRGMFWDRDRWYLVGSRTDHPGETRLWRADRVVTIAPDARVHESMPDFDVRILLGRNWLSAAMGEWRSSAPVVIRLSRRHADRLAQDWYYRHAVFTEVGPDEVLMTFGEAERAIVFDLLRWLGPGAELLEPREWRAALAEELRAMAALYADSD
jgi:predicted DNA-binding transcriptional regulator YafY